MSLLNRSSPKHCVEFFEALESRAMLSAPTITSFRFFSNATEFAPNGGTFNRTAPAGLNFVVNATPDTPSNKITKVQIYVDNDVSGTVNAGDIALGNAKKTITDNQFALTLTGKKLQAVPAGLSFLNVHFIAVVTAKDGSSANDHSKYLNVIGNMLPDASKASVTVTGPKKNASVAANGQVNFKFKGFSDPDGSIASYTILWDANNSGEFSPSFDYDFGTTTKNSLSATIPATNGKLNGALINFPLGGTVRFLVLAIDNDGYSSPLLSSAVSVTTGPSCDTVVTNSPDVATRTNNFALASIAKGGTIDAAPLKKVTFYTDTNNNGIVDKGDKTLGSVKLSQMVNATNLRVKNAKVAGKKVLAVVQDTLGFTSNVAITTAAVTAMP